MIERVATSVSRSLLSGLPESPHDGIVHSVFARAVNLEWGCDGWVSLLEEPLPLNPWAVRLKNLPQLGRGNPCVISRRDILFPHRAMRIDLEMCVPVDLGMRPETSVDPDFVRARCRPLMDLESRGQDTDPFRLRAREILDDVQLAKSGTRAAQHLFSLVGLGSGLTPAGDDFLAGFLAASVFFGAAAVERDFLVGALSKNAGPRTTDVSRRMLLAACRCEFAEPVGRLLRSIVRPGNGVEESARELLALGGSSGADTLAGILFCVREFLKG
ncbi:MAG: DUF2877 domain-containing protein [Candidatus Eisenbacteria sp.]|nr:DUF2877 domain-containing protein [Candidatus Eisenbacteria bacterium]